MRAAYPVSVAMAGVLPRTPLVAEGDAVTLHLPRDLAALGSERLAGRLRQLARLVGLEFRIRLSL
jgi:exopolyphosphatase/guanosine-5'-triphosphate,3'-diphosphate pyrophosphatase